MTDTDQLLRNRVSGFKVKDFYVFCSKFNVPKSAARSVLKHLVEEGYIKITWKSPCGARFFVKRGESNAR